MVDKHSAGFLKKFLLLTLFFMLFSLLLPGAALHARAVTVRTSDGVLIVQRSGGNVVIDDLFLSVTPAPDVLRLVDIANNASQIRTLAEGGHAIAELIMGFMYSEGQGATRNFNTAFNWFIASAEQGNARAMNAVAVMLLDGQGVRANQRQGTEWMREAALNGNAIAQRNLMHGYLGGEWGFRQNHSEAYRWGRRAALQGDAIAQYGMGLMYLYGFGVQQSVENAINWFREAAEQGHLPAVARLNALLEANRPAESEAESEDEETTETEWPTFINDLRDTRPAAPAAPSAPANETPPPSLVNNDREPAATEPPPSVADTAPPVRHPNRQMTPDELAAWIAAYDAAGGPNSFEIEMLAEVNSLRAAAGLPPLILDRTLSMAARLHSQLMAEHNFFSHTDPIYGSMRSRVTLFPGGYAFFNLGENLGGSLRNGREIASTQEPWRAVHSWQGSRPHWGHIFNDTRIYVGIGSVTDANGINRVTYLTGSRTQGNYNVAQQTDRDIRRGQQNMHLARPLPN